MQHVSKETKSQAVVLEGSQQVPRTSFEARKPQSVNQANEHTMRLRERSLLRSLFCFPEVPWGPNVTSALAWMAKGEIQETSLHAITEAILELKVKNGQMPTEPAVAVLLVKRLNTGPTHPKHDELVKTIYLRLSELVNGPDPLPLSIQESEAIDMIRYYKGRSLWRLVAGTEQNMRSNFYDCVELATALKEELEKAL